MSILFAIVGATGIGKSELSLKLAEHYGAEIIGMDSRQIYKDFVIGTAQPTENAKSRVKHHLVDFLSPSQVYSAGDFCRDVKRLQEDASKRFILVGGTGLYLQSLMLGLPQIPSIDSSIRMELEDKLTKCGSKELFAEALRVDPESVSSVNQNNAHRIIRILEVWQATGVKLSEWHRRREGGIGKLPVFWLQRDRSDLYERINARVDQMLKDGWLDEIQALSQTVPLDAPAWESLGYRELLSAKSATELKSATEEIKKKTRNYAKRQLTWFRWQVESAPIQMESENNAFSQIVNKLR